ncbi:MAG TPA: ABC transporter ATP-binding protein [Acidobacteriota bacterium]|nr:ABC transporter ATP-binding protein [Acidobacteriota bacterium]
MSPILEARELSKWYGQVIAVNKVSFSVGAGVIGLLGPNGAGKSTLMKLITGQLRPSQGEITLLGERIWNNYPLFHRIGFCPEQDSFYERMTGAEFLAALLRMHGYDEKDVRQRVDIALETVNLKEARDKKIAAYSKGMRQRIKMAQAVAHDPQVLILDEPLAGMDPIGRHETIRVVREWGKAGKCVVVSSHILHEIEAMTQNILLIHNGQVLAEGDVHQIRSLIDKHPHNIYIRCSEPRRLAELLVGFSDVESIRFNTDGKVLTVESRQPDEFYERLPELLLRHEIELEEITSPDDNLQAVFHYLVK